jgi:hypothetical protein
MTRSIAALVLLLTLTLCAPGDVTNFGQAIGAGLGGAALYQASQPVAVMPCQPTNTSCQTTPLRIAIPGSAAERA